jgi:hypothetical protein
MSFWPYYGLQRGITTTAWPDGAEDSAGITPGRPAPDRLSMLRKLLQLAPPRH